MKSLTSYLKQDISNLLQVGEISYLELVRNDAQVNYHPDSSVISLFTRFNIEPQLYLPLRQGYLRKLHEFP